MADQPPRFRFRMSRALRDPTGYYYTDWNQAVPVEVVASTEAEAYQKVWAMSGPSPRGRRWTARIRDVREVSAETEDER